MGVSSQVSLTVHNSPIYNECQTQSALTSASLKAVQLSALQPTFFRIKRNFEKVPKNVIREYSKEEEKRESQLTAAAGTKSRGSCCAVHCKEQEKKTRRLFFGIIFLTLFHFFIHCALAAKRLRLENFL